MIGIWFIYFELINKKMYGCDFLVSVKGVFLNIGLFLISLQVIQLQKMKYVMYFEEIDML